MKFMACFLAVPLILFAAACTDNAAQVQYVCTPCGNKCDEKVYSGPGNCKSCNMELVKKSAVAFNNLSLKQVCALLNKKDVVVLDVRTKGEFNGTSGKNYGHLKNAINIPIQELENRLSELKDRKDSRIIVYCSHSVRSLRAAHMLSQHGFSDISNMLEGISEWESSANCKEWLVK